MIIYKLEGDNTVVAEFDWAYKYTCPQAQWQSDLNKEFGKIFGQDSGIFATIGKVMRNKTSFCGRAVFDEEVSLEQAKKYAKKNLLTKWHIARLDCALEVHRMFVKLNSLSNTLVDEALTDYEVLTHGYTSY